MTLSPVLLKAASLQAQAMPLDLADFSVLNLASILALVGAAIAVWAMRVRMPLMRHLPQAQRPFWATFSLGLSLWAVSAAYSLAETLTRLPQGLPVAEAAWAGTLVCWMACIFLAYRYTRLEARAWLILDALVVIVAGVTLLERVVGAIGKAWGSGAGEAAASYIAPGLALTWSELHLAGVVALWAGLVLTRYLVFGPLPASHSVAIGAMLVALVGGEWWRWGVEGGQALSTLTAASTVGRVLAAILAVIAVYVAVYRPQETLRSRWAAWSPWLPIAGALALAVLAAEGMATDYFGSDTLGTLSSAGVSASDVSRKVIFVGVVAGLLLMLGRGGVAAVEAERLRHERRQLVWQNEEYVRLAISDSLTRLFNKGYFDYRLKVEWETSQRREQPLALVAMDIDNFKQVNDRYGHSKGDELLAEIGQVIRTTARAVDCPCRVGGDEFIIMLPETDMAGAMVVAERLRTRVLGVLRMWRMNLSPPVSISCGVSAYPGAARSPEELVEQTDAALYKAKQAGKNQIAAWTPKPELQTGPLAEQDARKQA